MGGVDRGRRWWYAQRERYLHSAVRKAERMTLNSLTMGQTLFRVRE